MQALNLPPLEQQLPQVSIYGFCLKKLFTFLCNGRLTSGWEGCWNHQFRLELNLPLEC